MRSLFQKIFKKPQTQPEIQMSSPVISDSARAAELKKKGNQLLAEGRLGEAGECYRAAALANPGDAFAFVNLGYVLSEQKDFLKAQAALQQAIGLDSKLHDAYFILGGIAQQQDDVEGAILQFRQTLLAEPDFEPAYRELGYELFRNDKAAEAENMLKEGIRRFPGSADLRCNLGTLYSSLNVPEKAVEIYLQALQLQPESAEIMSNLAAAYHLKGDLDQANSLLLRAFELSPNDAGIRSNLGGSMWSKARFAEALEHFDAAIALNPGHREAHISLGLMNLLLGNFEKGWTEYEWRFQGVDPDTLRARKSFPQPRWSGQFPLEGRTILLHCEQGFGDTLQFCRYVSEVAARGAKVVLEVQPGLRDVLAGLKGVGQLLVEGEPPLPYFDCHCPLMGLPMALGYRHEIGGPPVPYLTAEPHRIARWQERLPWLAQPGVPKIGLVWSGNPKHKRDHQRSLALVDMLRVLPEGIGAVCLQPEVRGADLALLAHEPRVTYLGAELKNFADTAALVASLDLVISVDTSVAHLAGALGKPVWVLVTRMPDWRWLLNRDDTPWYPATRIFRQAEIDDWSQPLREVRDALIHKYSSVMR